jgi:hypothetical protein
MQPSHHRLVRLTAVDSRARLQVDGLELVGGPTIEDWRGEWWEGEQLLLAAAMVSLLSSVRDHARKVRLAIGQWVCVGEAVIHYDRLIRIVLRVEVEAAPSDLVRTQQLFRLAKSESAVLSALSVPVELQVVNVPSGAFHGATP